MSFGGRRAAKQKAAQPVQPITILPSLAYDPNFPFTTPVPEDTGSIKSSVSGKTFETHNPSASPAPSRSGEESDSTCEVDAFPLERYSQSTQGSRMGLSGRQTKPGRGRSESPSQKVKPGLNIITEFPHKKKTVLGTNAVVDTVAAKRPKLGHRSVTSIKSSRVQLDYEEAPMPSPDWPQQFTNQIKGDLYPSTTSESLERHSSEEQLSGRHISPAARSILIGMSVPQAELAAHQHNSAVSSVSWQTPRTPSILITPAEGDSPWSADHNGNLRRRRPASSIYSTYTPTIARPVSEDAPPVPKVNSFLKQSAPFGNGISSRTFEQQPDQNGHASRQSFETDFDDEEIEPGEPDRDHGRRGSSESQEQILPGAEDGRHKSQGWWNLMLSPMLSRAGTVVSKKSPLSPTNKDFPPELRDRQREAETRFLTHETGPTARGLEVETTPIPTDLDLPSEQFHDNALRNLSIPGSGLAAEYYHACAIDEACGGQYFDCINHSCSERLPRLGAASDNPIRGLETGNPSTPTTRELDERDMLQSPPVVSPNVRQADAVSLKKAVPITRGIDAISMEGGEPSAVPDAQSIPTWPLPAKTAVASVGSSKRPVGMPDIRTVLTSGSEAVPSPGPVSPEAHRALAPRGAVPMVDAASPPAQPIRGIFITQHTTYPDRSGIPDRGPVSLNDIKGSKSEPAQRYYQSSHKDDLDEKSSKSSRRCCGLPCYGRHKEMEEKKPRHRRYLIGVSVVLLLITIACVLLAIMLTRTGTGTPVQSQWLNLTGFPPMPTGISTVVQPDASLADSSCVQPGLLWSCAIPKEAQWSVSPNDPDQPNFRFEITFRNGTVPANETQIIPSKAARSLRRASDPFTNDLFTPNPSPPTISDQTFMGNTTDQVTFPFNGESTPFYISFLSTQPHVPKTLSRRSLTRREIIARDSNNNTISTIPPPSTNPDGTAARANLLPTSPNPISQPIHLYNRGQANEHYGFYTYFDRSIFLRSASSPVTSSDAFSSVASIPGNANGGSTESAADMRCTWSQTRFVVKIWTNGAFGATLLGPQFNVDNPPSHVNSATDFTLPGSFPYPVTISLDRHGGDLHKKGLFCYGMDGSQHIIEDQKTLVAEDRGSGGTIINPAPPLINIPGEASTFDPSEGGIDGGTGGCGCTWQNFVSG